MGGKGGGSWKVAYADFVTAMMAFFLVMWIGAQDTKTRQSVANYFVDPSGVSKKPVKAGAVLDTVTYGNMPDQQKASMTKGRDSYDRNPNKEPSSPTAIVSNWLASDEKRLRAWKDRGRAAREKAAQSPEVLEGGKTVEEVAAKLLADQIRADFAAGPGGNPDTVYRDLLFGAIESVNWQQLAEDVMKN